MSGSNIGSGVGFIAGFFLPGGPSVWSTIGGIIGGWVDPTKVYGPRLSDAQTQTAMDGVPRAYGDGTFPCKGNLIWQDIVKEHKHKDDGKGSGQEQITYTYTRSYAIGVCKGPISGYKIIKRNGKIVFDARTDAELSALGYTAEQIAESRAAQAKFLQKCTLYYGTADQLPDATIVAVKGVGNVPAYTGTAYIVLTDDETMQGEVAQYEFVVANCGDRTEDYGEVARLLVTGNAKVTGGPMYAFADAIQSPTFTGISQATGADVLGNPYQHQGRVVVVPSGAGDAIYSSNIQNVWTQSNTAPSNTQGGAGGPNGWITYDQNASLTGNGFWSANPTPTDWDVYYPGTGVWHVSFSGGYYWISAPATLRRATSPEGPWDVLPNSAGIYDWVDIVEHGGLLYATCCINGNKNWQIRTSDDDGLTWSDPLLSVADTGHRPYFLCEAGGALFAWCLGGGLWTSADGWSEWIDTGIGGSGVTGDQQWQVDGGRKIASANNLLYVIGTTDQLVVFDPSTLSIVDTVTLPITAASGIVAVTESTDAYPIPDAPGYYIDPETGVLTGPPGTQISVCTPTLGSIVSKQCAKRVSADVIDVSELTDLVTGFRVAAPSSPQKNIGALMPGYFFDGSEYDGKLRFPKRGGEDSFALTVDDLCEREGDLIQWERTQEPELLRKLTVGYLDPDTTYTATTQQWERRSGTVLAQGEGTIELPIVGSKDWAAQAAHINGKVSWGEPDKCTFHTSIAQAKLVTAAVGTITDEAGTVHRVRIERIEDEGLVRMVEARRTRADLYESTVSGAAKPLPLFPGSNIRGPTDGLLLNLPVIVDANDVPGIAWAASGYLSGWAGTTLQFQRAGQWVDAGTVTLPATMGTLLADLPAHAGDIDNTNTLSVRMNDSLESVTFTNLLQERNPLAILYPDGTAEIVQFQTATEVATDQYDLTTLIRGRLNTVRGDHEAGARVVFLDNSVQYATLEPTDVGTTLTYRFVSLGTDPDAADVETLDLTTMQSQTEWPVDSLEVEKDGDDFILTWLARDRLGTDVFPIRSTNWRGYEVSWSYGGNIHTETVLTETVTFTLPGATDVTFSVAQLNLYTGAGPAQTVNIL